MDYPRCFHHGFSEFTVLRIFTISLFVSLIAQATSNFVFASDWPTWRHNASRSAAVSKRLNPNLHLHWVRQLPKSKPAWPQVQPKLRFDIAPSPIVAGQRLFVPSNVNDSVTAYSTRTGKELWATFADGPVRFAPLFAYDRIYFVSDDGYLYCVDANTGRRIWRRNGGPSRRLILGNERLISTWPARGAPVLHDGVVYFGASIWPFMGVFLHAIDAQSGETLWTNSGDGTNYTVQPHGASSFATVAPQGYLLFHRDRLIVPGGRSVPAIYRPDNGKLLHFEYDKKQGGHSVFAAGNQFFVGDSAFRIQGGVRLDDVAPTVFDGEYLYEAEKKKLKALTLKVREFEKTKRNRIGRKKKVRVVERREGWDADSEKTIGEIVFKTADLVWARRKKQVNAFEIRSSKRGGDNVDREIERVWKHEFDSVVEHMITADDRLFVVTEDCKLHCFANEKRTEQDDFALPLRPIPAKPSSSKFAKLLDAVRQRDGYVLVVNFESGQLVRSLLEESNAHIIVIDPDKRRSHAFRRRLVSAGLYGERVAVIPGDLDSLELPPYFANAIVSETQFDNQESERWLPKLLKSLRPYGGAAYLRLPKTNSQLSNLVDTSQFTITDAEAWTQFARDGALPGSDNWTHQYGDASQAGISLESRLRAPLGLLWFGGPTHEGILPRHGHGPSPQVAGGRVFIEGPNLLRATDVYTGRLLWEKHLERVGKYYDNTEHLPGASEVGSNYASTDDAVYLVWDTKIVKLDAATGEKIEFIKAEPDDASFGHISISGDYLIATSSPVELHDLKRKKKKKKEKDDDSDDEEQEKDEKEKSDEELVEVELIPRHARWRYHTDEELEAWNEVEFADSAWQQGSAGFGYGDGDDRTELSRMRGRFTRVFIRHTFDSKELDSVRKLELFCKFDDAFIAYLNGKEICRASIRGSGKDADVKSHEAEKYERFKIEDWHAKIQTGKNVLAIEGYNGSKRSSDFSLDPYLVAKRPVTPPPKLTFEEEQSKLRSLFKPTQHSSGSLRLHVFDRHTGQQLWQRTARYNFRHNTICAGPSHLFCIDNLTPVKQRAMQRRGLDLNTQPTLYALDLKSGVVLWKTHEKIFGTFLNYSVQHDTLVEGGSVYRDRAYDEVGKGLTAYKGATGKVRWRMPRVIYQGPCLLWSDKIITNGNGGFAIDLLKGEKTGWSYDRQYGCNTAIGCQNLLTFRSGAASYYDLLNDSGTGSIGGFRSSCTNNLIPANGVLSAPDYTRTCTCAYQNQTSLALIHTPSAELWTSDGETNERQPLAVNFGAPGDRRAQDGCLWVEFPVIGGKSLQADVKIEPKSTEHFRHHSMLTSGRMPWVTSSGLFGVRKITLQTGERPVKTIKLFFAEPHRKLDERRRFDVLLNNRLVLNDFDVAAEAGNSRVTVVREFPIQPKDGRIVVSLQAKGKLPTVISGIQISSTE